MSKDIDARVATEILGCRVRAYDFGGGYIGYDCRCDHGEHAYIDGSGDRDGLEPYSTMGGGALVVIEHLARQGRGCTIDFGLPVGNQQWWVNFPEDDDDHDATGDPSLRMAICLAALKVKL